MIGPYPPSAPSRWRRWIQPNRSSASTTVTCRARSLSSPSRILSARPWPAGWATVRYPAAPPFATSPASRRINSVSTRPTLPPTSAGWARRRGVGIDRPVGTAAEHRGRRLDLAQDARDRLHVAGLAAVAGGQHRHFGLRESEVFHPAQPYQRRQLERLEGGAREIEQLGIAEGAQDAPARVCDDQRPQVDTFQQPAARGLYQRQRLIDQARHSVAPFAGGLGGGANG